MSKRHPLTIISDDENHVPKERKRKKPKKTVSIIVDFEPVSDEMPKDDHRPWIAKYAPNSTVALINQD